MAGCSAERVSSGDRPGVGNIGPDGFVDGAFGDLIMDACDGLPDPSLNRLTAVRYFALSTDPLHPPGFKWSPPPDGHLPVLPGIIDDPKYRGLCHSV